MLSVLHKYWMRDEPQAGRFPLKRPFQRFGELGWIAAAPREGDGEACLVRSKLCPYEDDLRLTQGHVPRAIVARLGGGRFSHWNNRLYFSTSDGSDPNANGRHYSYDFSLDQDTWARERAVRGTSRWDSHPRGAYFRARGGNEIPPPFACSIALTNKCNLRCEICGSQKHLDRTGAPRRHMPFKTFEMVADTIFSLLSIVELNSQGDPLLYPNIVAVLKRIAASGCEIKLQHNGTLLTDKIVDELCRQCGTVMLSLDAVGSKFDEVRRGGEWASAAPGIDRLLKARDATKLSVSLYPTLTRRTIGEATNVIAWSAERGVDAVLFHRYTSVPGSTEELPTDVEYEELKDRLRQWCRDHSDPLLVEFESETMNVNHPPDRRIPFSTPKRAAVAEYHGPTFPVERDHVSADPVVICPTPSDYVEVGLDGQISACCRAQDVTLGYATSVESFADAWFGRNYELLRRSLDRNSQMEFALPNCEGCIKNYAPASLRGRRAIDYSNGGDRLQAGLAFDVDEITLEEIRKETGLCNIGRIPPGVCVSEFELWEDQHALGPEASRHDDIRTIGGGRYDISGRWVYFSTPDDTNPQRNHRSYVLRRKPHV